MKAFKLASARAITGMVAAAVESVMRSTEAVHEAAVQSVAHIEKHGDWTNLKTLMVGLKASGFRYQGVRIWIEAHSPIRFPADTKADGGFTIRLLKPTEDGYTPYNIEALWTTPFTDFEPAKERVGTPVYAEDFVKGITGAKARFLRLVENTNSDGTPIDAKKPFYRGNVATMLTFLGQLEALNAPTDGTKAADEKAAQRERETVALGAPARSAVSADAADLGAKAA